MFGLGQELRSSRRNRKKISYSKTIESSSKKRIKCVKNTRQSLSNSLLKTSKKVVVIEKRKDKEYPKNSKQTISKSKAVCKESSKKYKIRKSNEEEKLTYGLEMTQINRKLNKIGLKFPMKSGRKSKLPERKSLTNSTNSKKQFHQRKSLQHESFHGISFLEKEDGYALRSRLSDFLRVTRSNSSFLTPLQKHSSQKHQRKRNSARISCEGKQQRQVNRKMSFSSPVLQYKQNKNENAKASKFSNDSNPFNKEVKSTVSESADTKIHHKDSERKSSSKDLSKRGGIERPLRNNSKNISVDDIVAAPAPRPLTLRNSLKSFTPKLNLEPSKRKLDVSDTEVKVASEIRKYGNMRKKSEGRKFHLDNSARISLRRSARKTLSRIKVAHAPVNKSKCATVINTHCKVDCLTDDSLKIQTRRAKNITNENINDENSPLHNKRQRKRINDMKIKPTKTNQVDGSKGNKKTNVPLEKNKCKEDFLIAEHNVKQNKTLRQTDFTPIRYGKKPKEDKISNKKQRISSTSNLQAKQIRTNSARKQKNDESNASVKNIHNDKDSSSVNSSPKQTRKKRQTKPIPGNSNIKHKTDKQSISAHKKRGVKSFETPKTKSLLEKQIPFHSTPYAKNVPSSSKSLRSKASSLSTPNISRLPIDSLTTFNSSSAFHFNNGISSAYTMTPYFSKQKTHSLPITYRFMKNVPVEKRKAHSYTKGKISPDALKTKMPGKGTLKRKRWMLNALNEINVGYEDDIFESNNFGPLKTFQFGDESDNSSVNIATPKFDCIMTPALPKKTPRFKDCISPSELLLARKNAEEYLYRRNKKRKNVNEAATSVIKQNQSKKNLNQDVPEKKKLDFEEAMNKLNAIKNNLEQDDGDEEEDIYFSDVSD